MNFRATLVAGVALACLSTGAVADGQYFYRFPGSFGEMSTTSLSFRTVSNALLGGTVASEPSRLVGSGRLSLAATGGDLRVCPTIDCSTASGWGATATASQGDFVQVRVGGPVVPSQVVEATVSVGAAFSTSFRVVARSGPAAFSTVADASAAPGEARDADLSTFRGWVSTGLAVTGGEYRICASGGSCGSFGTAPGMISDGDQLQLRAIAGPDGTSTRVVAEAGGASLGWSLASRAVVPVADDAPDAVAFGTASSPVEPGGWAVSPTVRLVGHTGVPVSVSGGEYQVCATPDCAGAAWTTAATGAVSDGAYVRVRVRPVGFASTAVATLRAGSLEATWSATSRTRDTTPDAVTLGTGPAAAEPGELASSPDVVLAGFDDASISVSGIGASYSVNGGPFVVAVGSAKAGDVVRVRLAAGAFGETRTATLNIGGTTASFSVVTRPLDDEPDAIVPGVSSLSEEPGADRTWPAVVLAGFDAAPISVSGVGASYSLNGAAFTDVSGTAKGGDTVAVRLTAGPFGETRTATLTVGGVTADYVATTRARDTAPDAFSFGRFADAEPGATVVSAARTLVGFDDALVSVSDGEYALNDGPFVSTSGTARAGDRVRIRGVAGAFGSTTVVSLDVGGIVGTGSIVTRVKDTAPDAFVLGTGPTGVEPSTTSTSSVATLAGFDDATIAITGTGATYSLNGAAYTAVAGTAKVGDTVRVQLTAGAFGEVRTATLEVGGVAATWSSTVRVKDITPDAIVFSSKADAVPGTVYTSDIRRLTGHDGVSLSVSGSGSGIALRTCSEATCTAGSVGTWVTNVADAPVGSYVQLRMTAELGARTASISYGSLSADWSVTGVDQDPRNLSGDLYAWGDGTNGKLGNGYSSSYTPVKVVFPSGVKSLSRPKSFGSSACSLADNGGVYCWGLNNYGQIGNGSTINQPTPSKVVFPSGVTSFSGLTVGDAHACAIGSDSAAYCWGSNFAGEIGDGTTTNRSTPVKITLPAGVTRLTGLVAGWYSTCALGSDGNGYCWGQNSYGEIGDGTTTNRYTPTMVSKPSGTTGFKEITEGHYGRCGIASDDATYCWGNGSSGQIGNGDTANKVVPTKVQLPTGVAGFKDLVSGQYVFCGTGSDGFSYCWGYNNVGAIGDGTNTNRSIPTKVLAPSGVASIRVSDGGVYKTCGVGSDGNAYCWGWNAKGELGNGTTNNSFVPVKVTIPNGVLGLGMPSSGSMTTFAIAK